jgi:hypothetical protein
MNKAIWSAFLFLAFVFPALSQETGSSEYQRVAFTTIEKGQTISFREGDAANAEAVISRPENAEAVITDLGTWARAWEAYTGGQQALPHVDFNAQMIIISSRGEVLDVYVDRNAGILHVITGDIRSNSAQTVNLFHIVETERLEFQTVVFHHPLTGEDTSPNATVTQDVETQEVVPNCVYLSQWRSGNRAYGRATNNCSYTVRLRMIWAWATDSACYSLASGWQLTGWRLHIWPLPWPYVSELRSC